MQLRDEEQAFRQRGAGVVVVGNGGVDHARWFRDEEHIPFPVFTDPSRESYRRAGLKRGLGSAVSPRVFANAFRAYREGFRQTSTKGDAMQLGGVFVIAAGGRVLYEQRSNVAGEHPSIGELLAALDAGQTGPEARV